MGMGELKLFQKAYDFYGWLYPVLKNFPKSERFTLVQHVENSLLDFIGHVVLARKSGDTVTHLRRADWELERLKVFLRLARDLEFMSAGLYRESSERVTEMGRMVGGWLKSEGDMT